jgi:serine protease Do
MNLGRGLQALACVGFGLLGGSLATQQLSGQPAVPAAALAPAAQPALAPALPGREWQSFAPVVKRVLPGVVCIEGKGRAKRLAGEDTDPGFGSGVLIDPSGIIVTNNHVVAELDTVEVTLHDGRKFTTDDIRRDPKADIAIVKLNTKEPLPFLELGDSDAMEVGDRVLAFGAPFGLLDSVTSGMISAKNRRNLKVNQIEDFIQTDAAVNPGNSGGPLVNLDGKVIGLTAAIKTRTGGFQGVGLAVSSNLAKKAVTDLIKNGGAKRSHFGISARELDEASARKAGYKGTTGAVVAKVLDNSPAAKAGMMPGDVITKVNDIAIRNTQDLMKTISALPIGEIADVLLWRDGKFYRGKVKVEEERQALRPEPGADPKVAPKVAPPPAALPGAVTSEAVGLAMTDFTAEMAKQRMLPNDTKGAVISGVSRNSLAEKAGLARGLVVLKVDKTPVTSALSFEQALRAADTEKGAMLNVLKPNGDVDFMLLRLK